MKSFALIGTAGYVAPRHLKAIHDIGANLVASFDPHDSVGILDHYFPESLFFTDYSRFERFINSPIDPHLNSSVDSSVAPHFNSRSTRIDYVSVCSPNYLHDTHIRLALNAGCDVICEKPLVINPWNLDALELIQERTGKKVFSVMQLRYHPELLSLKNKLSQSGASIIGVGQSPDRILNDPQKSSETENSPSPAIVKQNNFHTSLKPLHHKVKLTYITKRGNWYHYSWKGNEEKSGGIAVNIGIHLFDLLIWLFGPVKDSKVFIRNSDRMKGELTFENASVDWYLSIAGNDLPSEAIEKGSPTFRSLTIDGQEINFTDGFTDLHTEVYRRTLAGEGLSISDARPSIELTHSIRTSELVPKII